MADDATARPTARVKKVASQLGEHASRWKVDISLPDFTMPDVKLPKLEIPKVDLPKVELPKVDLSKVKLPEITRPDFAAAAGSVSEFTDKAKAKAAAGTEQVKTSVAHTVTLVREAVGV